MNAESDLKISMEEPRNWARRMTITVPAARVDAAREDVARQLAQRVRLPGFRAGRVPSKVIEKKYGAAIENEAIERVVGEAYKSALEQSGLQPITQGSVDNVDYSPGAELTFTAEFEVRPEIELARLSDFMVERPKTDIDDAELGRVLDRLREQEAAWKAREAGHPEAGDLVKVEITPLDEEGGEPRPYEFVLGEGQAVEDVEDAIRTLEPGGEGEFTVRTAPAEGQEAEGSSRVRIRLVEAKQPELPELDDAFAKSVGDFETLDALRARVREDLQREAEAEAERAVRSALLDSILEANPFEVPDSMVDRYLDQMIRPRDGADAQRVAEARQQARGAAEAALKRMLIVERVAAMESLKATPDEVDSRIEEIAQRTGRDPGEVWAQFQKSGRLEALEEEITESKVFDYLKSKSTIA